MPLIDRPSLKASFDPVATRQIEQCQQIEGSIASAACARAKDRRAISAVIASSPRLELRSREHRSIASPRFCNVHKLRLCRTPCRARAACSCRFRAVLNGTFTPDSRHLAWHVCSTRIKPFGCRCASACCTRARARPAAPRVPRAVQAPGAHVPKA